MGIEIERRFLVQGNSWREGKEGMRYRQGYLSSDPDCTVRVRIAGTDGFLTIKGRTSGLSRLEFEYPIPPVDALEMLAQLCRGPQIEKDRYERHHCGHRWVVDVFFGRNHGLILAEIELTEPGQSVPLPDWVGPEVSTDPRYFNVNLARHPYSEW
jgi:adenylate cyclase